MVSELRNWVSQRVGVVRLRQFANDLSHRLSFIPGLYVIGAAIAVQLTLYIDRSLQDDDVPIILSTTVDSASAVLSALAGGLITSITLLLSMMLVTVQLASSQFSPRTLRNWLGDRTLQNTVGLVLGTTVFCLLGLRSTRSFSSDGVATTVPHSTVLVAVILGVVSLIAVVRSVDHITHSLLIGSVAERLATSTIQAIEAAAELRGGTRPSVAPATVSTPADPGADPDVDDIADRATPIEAPVAGWVQQIDDSVILDALPAGSTAHVVATIGGFVPHHAPLMWIDPPFDEDDHELIGRLRDGLALGESRTMQQDIGFGLLQLTDIAVRALSPGINDPTTARDVVVHEGNVFLALWSKDTRPARTSDEDRTVLRRHPDHGEMLAQAFGPIRRYAIAEPDVLATMVRSLVALRSETIRRDLPGPIEPIDAMMREIQQSADRSTWSDVDGAALDSIVDGVLGPA